MRELFEFETNEEHLEITTKILSGSVSEELIIHAASIRGFLG
jgi:phosphoenolpyruvate carboxylase